MQKLQPVFSGADLDFGLPLRFGCLDLILIWSFNLISWLGFLDESVDGGRKSDECNMIEQERLKGLQEEEYKQIELHLNRIQELLYLLVLFRISSDLHFESAWGWTW
ncbi:hypothetical protein POM88_038743 [Heracleum sosnowskyi]|uniref:Uncharacterized protein n=1 Tax=Heracleum sosnowskyi TaxID=360622 RepID=A0AAD8M894_9APIA|nr:hypothetical protein POM88_038743 [Heracleum sosnowskyi]